MSSEIIGSHQSRRILVVDDNRSIHNDFRKILQPHSEAQSLDEARASLFGSEPLLKALVQFDLDYADQGQSALALVQLARPEGWPYAMAFVDMRMPPGLGSSQQYKKHSLRHSRKAMAPPQEGMAERDSVWLS